MKNFIKKIFRILRLYPVVGKYIKAFQSLKFKFLLLLKHLGFHTQTFELIYHNFKLKLSEFESIDQYIEMCPNNVDIIYMQQKLLSYAPPCFVEEAYPEHTANNRLHKQYAALFYDAQVIGGSNLIILKDGNVLYEMKTLDTKNRYLYSDGAIKYYTGPSVIYSCKNSKQTIDTAIWFGGNYSWNYYHFTFEILTKFIKLAEMKVDRSIPILVDQICCKIPQFKELVNYLNTDNRKIIYAADSYCYKVNRLLYINSPNFIPPNFNDDKDMQVDDIQFDYDIVTRLRCCLLNFKADKKYPERFYVTRKNASSRRKFNEEDVFATMAKYGFVEYAPEILTVSEQMSLFNSAEFVAGGSGAAFTNLLYGTNKMKVLLFSQSKLPFSGFSSIADCVGIDLKYFVDNTKANNNIVTIHDNFKIDVDALDDFLCKNLK